MVPLDYLEMSTMANKPSKTSKTTVNPATAACAKFADAIVTACKGKTEADASLSKSCIDAIVALFAVFTDAAAYQAALIDMLGNGLKGKANLTGSLKGKLEAAGLHRTSFQPILTKLRKIAGNWSNPEVQKIAQAEGMAAAYKFLTPKAKPAAAEAEAAPADAYSPDKLHAMIAEHFDDALVGLEQYMLRAGDTIGLGKLTEVKIHLARKTGTKG